MVESKQRIACGFDAYIALEFPYLAKMSVQHAPDYNPVGDGSEDPGCQSQLEGDQSSASSNVLCVSMGYCYFSPHVKDAIA
jgi:hypothetical protein